MQKHQLNLFIVLLFISITTIAQNRGVDQALGLMGSRDHVSGVVRLKTASTTIDAAYTMRVQQFGFVYTIRKDLIQWRGGSVSIGSPMMLGFSFTNHYKSYDFNGTKTDTVLGKKGGYLAFEIPVVADLNIGLHSASDESKNSFGIYVGGGYQYSYTKILTSVGKIPLAGFDAVLRAGLRMGKAWENRWSLGFNMRGVSTSNRTYSIHWLKEL